MNVLYYFSIAAGCFGTFAILLQLLDYSLKSEIERFFTVYSSWPIILTFFSFTLSLCIHFGG